MLVRLSVDKLTERSRSDMRSGLGVAAAEGTDDLSRLLTLSLIVELRRLSGTLSRSTPREWLVWCLSSSGERDEEEEWEEFRWLDEREATGGRSTLTVFTDWGTLAAREALLECVRDDRVDGWPDAEREAVYGMVPSSSGKSSSSSALVPLSLYTIEAGPLAAQCQYRYGGLIRVLTI